MAVADICTVADAVIRRIARIGVSAQLVKRYWGQAKQLMIQRWEWRNAKLHNEGIVAGSKDLVCGMTVPPDTKHRYIHGGEEFLFCSSRCRDRFVENPATFIHSEPVQTPQAKASENTYTCPMHPEVRKEGPGSCPKCGM